MHLRLSECGKTVIRADDICDLNRKFFVDHNNFSSCNKFFVCPYVERLPNHTIEFNYRTFLKFQKILNQHVSPANLNRDRKIDIKKKINV